MDTDRGEVDVADEAMGRVQSLALVSRIRGLQPRHGREQSTSRGTATTHTPPLSLEGPGLVMFG